jgi:hypothetical protein
METDTENKTDYKDKIINFYNYNKKKIYLIFVSLILIIISLIFIKQNNQKKNNLIAEKYVQAGILLNSNQKKKAKNIYEEIILSKNNFYSILSLNTIIEKELVSDKKRIMEYFDLLEKSTKEINQKDLLVLKKALFLIKSSDIETGNYLLKSLVDKNSSISKIARDLL